MDKAKDKNKILFIIIFTLFLTGVTCLTSSQPVWANIPINIIIPIFILMKLDTVFFEKLKLSTLVVMRILILFVVFGLMSGDLFVKINLAFLGINIMEATITDYKKAKYYNAFVGVLLTLTILLLKGNWSYPYYTARGATNTATICWIIVYSIWNWIFVTNEFSSSIALYHVAILATPILATILFKDPGMWLMFRAYSLTTGGNIQIAKKSYLEEKLKSEAFSDLVKRSQKDKTQLIVMLVNILLIGIMIVTTIVI